MGFNVYLQCFGVNEQLGISRSAVRCLFPVVEDQSQPDYWLVRYDDRNSCNIDVGLVASDSAALEFLCVEQPCADRRLWEGLFSILQMGEVVMYWPSGPPVVADVAVVPHLPEDMVQAIGPAQVVSSGEEIRRLLRKTKDVGDLGLSATFRSA